MTTSATLLATTTVRLADLDIAPENPRFGEGPDDLIPDLATSLAPEAAGLLVPLLVRRGVKKEKPFMVLDGRRRLFGFRHLLSQGVVSDDLELPAYLCESKDSIAAAAITANQARVPLKPVEIILAIRALAVKKIPVEAIARALSVDLAEARRYHAVSQVHMDVLHAFRDKLFDFQVLKLIARVRAPAEQKALAKAARVNGRLWAGHVQDYLDEGTMSADSPVIRFVGLDAYRAAGGRTVSDLLAELPDTCTDVDIAYRLWGAKLEPLRAHCELEGVTLFISTDTAAELPDEFCALPYRYTRPKAEQAELAALKSVHDDLTQSLEAELEQGDMSAWERVFVAKLACAKASAAPMTLRAMLLRPDDRDGIRFTPYTTEDDVATWRAQTTAQPSSYTPEPTRNPDPMPARPVVVDTSDHGHAFHSAATEILVRGFRVALSENFVSALKLQVASQFQQIVLIQPFGTGEDKALRLSCGKNVQSRGYLNADQLDKDLVERLLVYRDRYVASGKRPYAWVCDLGLSEIQDLLTLMTAANVWLEEERTDRIKPRARAELQEVAEELDFDLRTYWFPDGAFYARGSKKQLLRYASQMGCDLEELVGLKKTALADFVAEQGVIRQWQPAALSFANADLGKDDDDQEHPDDVDTLASAAEVKEADPPAIAAE